MEIEYQKLLDWEKLNFKTLDEFLKFSIEKKINFINDFFFIDPNVLKKQKF